VVVDVQKKERFRYFSDDRHIKRSVLRDWKNDKYTLFVTLASIENDRRVVKNQILPFNFLLIKIVFATYLFVLIFHLLGQ
jgi:hypothetical protein